MRKNPSRSEQRNDPMSTEDPTGLWYVQGRNPGSSAGAGSSEVVFSSPVVHRPQQGKMLTAMYLNAAMRVLNNESFRYLHEWHTDHSAVLEFELVLDGITINGVDMIWWNAAGRITAFKVMVRPLKGVNMLHQKMAEMLAAMQGGGA